MKNGTPVRRPESEIRGAEHGTENTDGPCGHPHCIVLIKMGGLLFALGVLILGLVGFREYRNMLTRDGIQVYRATGLAGTALLIAAAGLGQPEWLLPW